MPIDRGNHSSDYLREKIDLNNFNNLKYTNKYGRINKIRSFLSSHQLVTSIKKGKNSLTPNNEIQYLVANFESLRREYDFDSYSWILNAYFDKENPDRSILNVAFPSAIAYYYVTLVFPGSDYTFSGKFFESSNYESSLTVYTSDGNLNPDFISINTYNTNLSNQDNVISSNQYNYLSLDSDNTLNYRVSNKSDNFFWVLQRFYVNMDVYNNNNLVNNLFTVYDHNKNQVVPKLNTILRNKLSNKITFPIQKLLSFIAEDASSAEFSPFYFPKSTSGLFPDGNHFYLVSLPGEHQLFKVTGTYQSSLETPYIDFITVNQDSTATDNGLPFYDFVKDDQTYEIYIATNEISLQEIKDKSQNENPIVLRYQENNNNRMLIFRIITYSKTGVSQFDSSRTLSPEETKQQMTSGLYPTIVKM